EDEKEDGDEVELDVELHAGGADGVHAALVGHQFGFRRLEGLEREELRGREHGGDQPDNDADVKQHGVVGREVERGFEAGGRQNRYGAHGAASDFVNLFTSSS